MPIPTTTIPTAMIGNESDWSKFELRFEFYGPYSRMRPVDFYGWKMKLGKIIYHRLNRGHWRTNGKETIGGFINDPQNCGLYLTFYRKGTRHESLCDMYWNCVWEICTKIIFPAVRWIGYNPFEDVSVFIAYSDSTHKTIQNNWQQIYGR